MDLTVATELGGLAVFGDRRSGYGWLTGFDGYNRVSSCHYCCFHFYCHNRESSWWSEGQSEQFGSVVVICSLHKVLIQLPSRSSPGCPQTSQVRKASRSAASMRWRMASSAPFTWMRSPPNFSSLAESQTGVRLPALIRRPKVPSPRIAAKECRPSHRHEGSPSTGRSRGRCPGYVVDHVRPLECGGADAPSNMQWQTVADGKAKDKTEGQCR